MPSRCSKPTHHTLNAAALTHTYLTETVATVLNTVLLIAIAMKCLETAQHCSSLWYDHTGCHNNFDTTYTAYTATNCLSPVLHASCAIVHRPLQATSIAPCPAVVPAQAHQETITRHVTEHHNPGADGVTQDRATQSMGTHRIRKHIAFGSTAFVKSQYSSVQW